MFVQRKHIRPTSTLIGASLKKFNNINNLIPIKINICFAQYDFIVRFNSFISFFFINIFLSLIVFPFGPGRFVKISSIFFKHIHKFE